jgi:hypothetical protein
METRLTVKFKRGGRRPRSHGGYSYLTSGTLPKNRANVLKYLIAARDGLIRDLGPSEKDLTTAQIIIIDRVIGILGVLRCVEEFIREHSVLVGNELAPSLQASYLAFCNSLRLSLLSLGLERKTEAILTPFEIVQLEKKESADEHN